MGCAVSGALEYYVATNGSDGGTGQSLSDPFRTIQKALNVVQPGDTVWVRGGTYRESAQAVTEGQATSWITICAYANENPVLKGSWPVTNWVEVGGGVWKSPDWGNNSQQVFVDGASLQQIGWPNAELRPDQYQPVGLSLENLTPSSFFYSPTDGTLYVWLADGTAPTGRLVEASRTASPLIATRAYYKLKQLAVRHSDLMRFNTQGAAMDLGSNTVAEGCSIQWCDFAGVSMSHGAQLLGCDISHNGVVGIQGYGRGIVVRDCLIASNNYRNFRVNWHAGGMKLMYGACGLFEKNEITGNFGHGIWFDHCRWSDLIHICYNFVHHNQPTPRDPWTGANGIFLEVTKDALVHDNLLLDNEGSGIVVAESDNIAIFNNTIAGTRGSSAIGARCDMRRLEYSPLTAGYPDVNQWLTFTNNQVVNNLVYDNHCQYDFTWPTDCAATDNWIHANSSDHNLFYRRDGTAVWHTALGGGVFSNLAAFTAATGYDSNSLTLNPRLASAIGGDFRPAFDSPCVDAGTNAPWMTQAQDYAGTNRILFGGVDIGCYEFNGSAAALAPAVTVTSAVGTVSYDVTGVQGINNGNVVGAMWAVVMAGGAGSTVGVTRLEQDRWEVKTAPLEVGVAYTVTVYGTNINGVVACDTAAVERAGVGTGLPVVTVTNAGSLLTLETSCGIGGTNNLHVDGTMWWVVRFHGADVTGGTFAASGGRWSVTITDLQTGRNEVVVGGANLWGVAATDRLLIEQGETPAHYVATNASAPSYPYTSWATAARRIQDAVEAAADGDTVWVGPGKYYAGGVTNAYGPSHVIVEKGIALRSATGAAQTVIGGVYDGGPTAQRCVLLNHSNAVLEGFTLADGQPPHLAYDDNIRRGGGALVMGFEAMRDCMVTRCDVRPYGSGGGISVQTSTGRLYRCEVWSNAAARGGGLAVGWAPGAVVSDCIVRDNQATESGGGLVVDNSTDVRNCLITGNAADKGGGVEIVNWGAVWNCTVENNTAALRGDGFYLSGNAALVRNTICFSNGVENVYALNAALAHRIEYSCTTPLTNSAFLLTGTLFTNPVYAGASTGNYRLASASPCRDAGLNAAWMSNRVTDLDGRMRLVNGRVDLGAYEYGETVWAAHAADGYRAGTTLTVTASVRWPEDRALHQLSWTPELPTGWNLTGASGDGQPQVVGGTIAFSAFPSNPPLQFTYQATVPVGEDGTRAVGGAVVFKLEGMTETAEERARPDPLELPPYYHIELAVSGSGTLDHASGWYLGGSNMTVGVLPAPYWHWVAWTGDTNGAEMDEEVIVLPVTQSRNVTAVLESDLYRLTVVSQYGMADPPAGTNWFAYGSLVHAAVTNPVYACSCTQNVCTGWVGTGAVPSSGTNHAVDVTLTQNSLLVWQWAQDVWLETAVAGSGTVNMASGWKRRGSRVGLQAATPESRWRFGSWTGDTYAATLDGTNMTFYITSPRSITAVFVPTRELAVSSAYGAVSPAPGVHVLDQGTQVVCRADTGAVSNRLCAGWLGTGSAPVSGGGDVAEFALADDTAITWQWSAAQGEQATRGYRSQGTGTWAVVDCRATFEPLSTLTQVWWRPQMPANWNLRATWGEGEPQLDGGVIRLHPAPGSGSLAFHYLAVVPDGERGAQAVGGRLGFNDMTNTIAAAAASALRRHSADGTNAWPALDDDELARVLDYWRAGAYHVAADTPDGYAAGAGPTGGPRHSADYGGAEWALDFDEVLRPLAYWRAGGYTERGATADGFAPAAGAADLLAGPAEPGARYVNAAAPAPEYPYTNWAMAARAIQDAVAAAGAGETVYVGPGLYDAGGATNAYGAARILLDKGVRVQSLAGAAETVILGGGTSYAMRCVILDHSDARLSGFTLRDGRTAGTGTPNDLRNGGGALVLQLAEMTDCVVENGDARPYGNGGGLYIKAPTGAVRQCIVRGSRAYAGGGVAIAQSGVALAGCVVQSNAATASGGGLWADNSLLVRSCLVVDNETEGYGGGADLINNVTLWNCTVENNRATQGGDGIALSGGTVATLWNTLFSSNAEENLYVANTGLAHKLAFCCTTPFTGTACNVTGTVFTAPGYADPAAGNYTLAAWSPCRDSGWTAAWMTETERDVAGHRRVVNDAVDRGAHEYWTLCTATHAATGYVAGTTVVVSAQVDWPPGEELLTLGWQMNLPWNWTLVGADGDGAPEVRGQTIVFIGALTNRPLRFTCRLAAPADATGNAMVSAWPVWQLRGMDEPAWGLATPYPLTLRPLHWLELSVNGGGSVQPTSGWQSEGSNVVVRIGLQPHWHFTGWSGDTNDAVIWGGEITLPMTNARHVTANFALDQHQLVVASPVGEPWPAVGTNWLDYGTTLLCIVSNPVLSGGGTQFVCTGWSGSGAVPDGGATNAVPVTLTSNSTLRWQWDQSYWLQAEVVGSGTLNQASDWITTDHEVQLEAVPSPEWRFRQWGGDTADANVDGAVIQFEMTRPRSLTAEFAPTRKLVVASAYGTPEPAVGTNVLYGGEWTHCSAGPAPVTAGGQEYLCAGWAGAGSVPSAGGADATTVWLDEDSALAWQWSAVSGAQTSRGYRCAGALAARVDCMVDLDPVATVTQLWWRPALPSGWQVAAVGGEGTVGWDGDRVTVRGGLDDGRAVFHYVAAAPAGERAVCDVGGRLGLNDNTNAVDARPLTLPLARRHSADYTNEPWALEEEEIARLLTYWLERTGTYHAAASSADGYTPGEGLTNAQPHDADVLSPSWELGQFEVLRMTAFWRAGGYEARAGTADGFAPRYRGPGYDGGAAESGRFVAADSANPQPPYTNWAMAARSIQDAVDAASGGETVYVGPGLYDTGGVSNEYGLSRVVVDKAVTVRSTAGPEATVILGGGTGGAMRCVLLNHTNAVLAGFTLRDGRTAGSGMPETVRRGGGAFIHRMQAMRDCVVEGGDARPYGLGGGVYAQTPAGTFERCVLRGNQAYAGGGLAVTFGDNLRVAQCLVESNRAVTGGGLWVDNCRQVRNCLARHNTASDRGGGAQVINNGALWNCTVEDNTADNGGDGLYLSGSAAEIYNTVFYQNGTQNLYAAGTTLVHRIEHCCTTPLFNTHYSTTGTLFNAPGFADTAAGDYRLGVNSPCRDTGVNASWMTNGAVDLDGGARVAGATVDMGAYEFGEAVSTQAVAGYRPGEILEIPVQVDWPAGRALWAYGAHMALPWNWTLAGADGDGAPVVRGNEIILTGAFTNRPLRFTYRVQVPADADGAQTISMWSTWQLDNTTELSMRMVSPYPLALQPFYRLDVEVLGNGSATTSPTGTWHQSGSNVTLTAAAGAHAVFAGWLGEVPEALTNDNPLQLVMDQSRQVTARFAWEQVTLTVQSEYGTAEPSGIVTQDYGAVLACGVSGWAGGGAGTQYECAGWTGAGSVPPAGDANQTGHFVLTNNSSLAWLWVTNYYLQVGVVGAGDVDTTSGWRRAGAQVVLSATPGLDWSFGAWEGDTNNCMVLGHLLFAEMTGPRSITARFVLVDDDQDGMADLWEVRNFGDMATGQAGTDYDGDGSPDTAEYRAGTEPTNRWSALVAAADFAAGDPVARRVVCWSSVSQKVYSVWRSTDLAAGFFPLSGLLPATPPVNVYTDVPPSDNGRVYYRIRLE